MINLKPSSKHERPEVESNPWLVAQRIHAYLQQMQPWTPGKVRPTRLLTPSEEELNLGLPYIQYGHTVLGNLVYIIRHAMMDRFSSLPKESNVVFYRGTTRRSVPEVMLEGLSPLNPLFNPHLRSSIDADAAIEALIDAALSPLPGGIELSASHTSAQVSAVVSNGYGHESRVPFNERVILEAILPKGSVMPVFGGMADGVVAAQVPLSAITGVYLPGKNGGWSRFRVENGEIRNTDQNHPTNRVQTSMPLSFSYNPVSTPIVRDDLCQEPARDSKLLVKLSEHFGPLF